MSYPDSPDVLVEICCDSATDPGVKWRNISEDVLWSRGVDITQGRTDGSVDTPSGSCDFVLKDPAGDYSRRNPMSQYFGFLGKGTPLQVRKQQEHEEFGTTVVNGWGTATSGQAWTHSVTGNVPVPTDADFDKSGGIGTVVVPAATNTRIAYLADALHADVDLECTWSTSAAVTGAFVLPGGLIAHGQSLTDFLYVRIEINPDNSVTCGIRTDDGAVLVASVTVPGLTYATGVDFSARLVVSGRYLTAKVWRTDQGEPVLWTVEGYQSGVPKKAGWVGLRTATGTGNTNANFVVSYKSFVVRADRFAGEIASFRPLRDISGKFTAQAIQGAGALRRFSTGDANVLSALRRAIPGATDLVAYWPMEEGDSATRFESAVLDGTPLDVQSDAQPNFAANSEFRSSAPLPTLGSAVVGGLIPNYNATINGSTQLRFVMRVPDSGSGVATNSVIARVWGTGSARLWQILYQTTGTLTVEAYDRSVNNILVSPAAPFAVDGKLLRVSLELDQNGANVDWRLSVYEVGASAVATTSGTLVGYTIKQATYLDFNASAAFTPAATIGSTVIGHVTVQSSITSMSDVMDEFNAYVGEAAGLRARRLCAENLVPLIGYDLDDTVTMGAQRVSPLLTLLRQCAKTDQGTLYESRAVTLASAPVLEYRTLASEYAQQPMLTLDLSAGQVAPPWEPIDDDQLVRNDVTAKRTDGSSFRAELAEGPMSVLPAVSGGTGRYETSYEVNTEFDSQLQDAAGWQLALGTVDEYRIPEFTVDLGSPNITDALARAALDVNIDDLVVITNAQSSQIYNDVRQLARGYREVFTNLTHVITFNCSPAAPYDVTVLDTDPGYLDGESTVLYSSVTSSATSLLTWSRTETWSSTVPYPLLVGGERMTCTACTAAAPALVAAGTAAHADNASVVPGLPAGLAEGQLLTVLAAIRNSGTGVPTVSALTALGYVVLIDASNVVLFGKIATAADLLGAPTVSFTGGAAGATTSAQMACFTGALPLVVDSNNQLNGSAQDILVSAPLTMAGGASLVIMVGWKQDDWTSVATLSPLAEIGEPSSILGNDQGLVWDWMACNGTSTGPTVGPSFTVTGGAAAISRSGAVCLPASQTMTVTRGVNGITKAHAANAAVHVAEPARIGL
ncbi:hypothetical protein [Umezawaea tangerina]|uniref:Uncharacterized protein n=1 Tax=Umezawaea tangerina TaxID=84725 RepID=A0A2T0SPI3_9PSEU|nr:hypothetical protein [Umezawaea tangerina]PRY35331.1 hypothetical protein CLV43_114249 [Umezawaea tangerina]